MNKLLLAVVLFTGCVGSATPHNPMNGNSLNTVWWQSDTFGVKATDNPWNKFVPTYKEVDETNPWADFEEPKLFPKNWKARLHLNLDLKWQNLKLQYHLDRARETIKELLRPKVEKTLDERLRELRKREKEFFDRSI